MITSPEVINELLSIEAFASSLKQRATVLRKKLEGETSSASRKGLNETDKANLISRRTKSIIKNQSK